MNNRISAVYGMIKVLSADIDEIKEILRKTLTTQGCTNAAININISTLAEQLNNHTEAINIIMESINSQ